MKSAMTRFLHDTQKIANDANSQGLQVIAAGQWRCATSSLQLAFEEKLQPPLAPSMHGAYLMPHVERLKAAVLACREQDKTKRQAALHKLFAGYNASSDYPGLAFVDDLLEMYPNAKIILNKRRSPEEWVHSVQSTLAFFSTTTYLILTFWWPQNYWHYQLYQSYQELCKRRFGISDIFSVELYERHNQWVRDLAREKGREVLEWEPSMGWQPLCEFVGREVPAGAFPQMNEGREIRAIKWWAIRRGLRRWAAILGVPLFVLWSWRFIGSRSGQLHL